MSSKLDLSLDDISKAQKKSGGGRGGGRGGRGRGGARGRGNRGGRGGRSSSRGRGGRQRPTPYSRPFNAPNRTAMISAQQQQKSRLVGATKVSVSNLAREVTKEDVEEIFQQVGPVKSAIVHYDQEGRSLGTAEVTFKNKGSAEKAVEEYDRAEVDGRPMYIRLQASIAPSIKLAAPRVPRYQPPAPSRGRGAGRGRGSARGGARGGRGRAKSTGKRGGKTGRRGGKAEKPATAESLDAEMDAYHAKGAAAPAEAAAAGQPPPASAAAAGQPSV